MAIIEEYGTIAERLRELQMDDRRETGNRRAATVARPCAPGSGHRGMSVKTATLRSI